MCAFFPFNCKTLIVHLTMSQIITPFWLHGKTVKCKSASWKWKSIRGLHELNIELFRLNWVFMWNDCMLHKRRTQLKTQTELYYLLVNCTWASFTPNEWNANIEFIKSSVECASNMQPLRWIGRCLWWEQNMAGPKNVMKCFKLKTSEEKTLLNFIIK